MSNDPFDAVSEPKREIVRAALVSIFGIAPLGSVTSLSGGASGAAIFRVEAGGRPYLLRVEGRHSPLRNPHQYVSLGIAAEAGLAPRPHFVDEANGILICDFISQRPLADFPGGRRTLVPALGALLRQLQETPVFPYFVDYPDIVTRLFAHVRRTGLFADGLLDAHWDRLTRISQTWDWDRSKLVSAHNDPNPRNILFDGKRLWLIDWESAYRNDPLVDVAILLDNLAPSPELENALLRSWLGRAPDGELLERLEVIRALTRLYYAGVLFSASATQPRTEPDGNLAVPSAAEFESALRQGRIRPGSPESVHLAGKVYLASFLNGAAVPALDTI